MHESEKRTPSVGGPGTPEAAAPGEAEAAGERWEGYSVVVLNDFLDS